MNDFIAGNGLVYEDLLERAPMYAGTITSGVATDFITFCKVADKVIKLDAILADPLGCEIPADLSLRWVTITSLVSKATKGNFDSISMYVDRFPTDNRILFYRMVLAKHPQLQQTPAFARAASVLTKYLFG